MFSKKALIKTKKLQRIGAGAFAECYRDNLTNLVYSFVRDYGFGSDSSKEGIARWADKENPHVPRFEILGQYEDGGDYGWVYTSPFYYSITKNSQAEKDFKVLAKIFKKLNPRKIAWDFNCDFLNELYNYDDGVRISPHLYAAVDSMINAISNCGSDYKLEIRRVNLKMDENGTLILLDLFFPQKIYAKMKMTFGGWT